MNCFIGLFYEAFFNANYGYVAQVKQKFIFYIKFSIEEFQLLTIYVIVNAILLKFTEQIGPYIFKRVKKNQLARRGSSDVKLTDAVKQAKTLTTFDVILYFVEHDLNRMLKWIGVETCITDRDRHRHELKFL